MLHPNRYELTWSHQCISVEQERILLGTYNWTLGSIWWRSMKSPWIDQKSLMDFRVIFCFFRLKLFPIALRFSAEILSLRWIPVSEWVLGTRSLSLIFSLNHLPMERQILSLFGLSGLLLHPVFWDKFLMHPNFPILQYQQSECLLSKFLPRSKHIL